MQLNDLIIPKSANVTLIPLDKEGNIAGEPIVLKGIPEPKYKILFNWIKGKYQIITGKVFVLKFDKISMPPSSFAIELHNTKDFTAFLHRLSVHYEWLRKIGDDMRNFYRKN